MNPILQATFNVYKRLLHCVNFLTKDCKISISSFLNTVKL